MKRQTLQPALVDMDGYRTYDGLVNWFNIVTNNMCNQDADHHEIFYLEQSQVDLVD